MKIKKKLKLSLFFRQNVADNSYKNSNIWIKNKYNKFQYELVLFKRNKNLADVNCFLRYL